jgi:hypothetical protein
VLSLRLHDNAALQAAIAHVTAKGGRARIFPAFVHAPGEEAAEENTGGATLLFARESLRALSTEMVRLMSNQARTYTRLHIYIHMWTRTCAHTHIHTYKLMYIHMDIHTRVSKHSHIRRHTHMQMQAYPPPQTKRYGVAPAMLRATAPRTAGACVAAYARKVCANENISVRVCSFRVLSGRVGVVSALFSFVELIYFV